MDAVLSGLVEGVGDDGGMDAVGQEEGALLEECAGEDDDSGGAVPGDGVLGLGELDEELGGRLEDVHAVEDGGAVVGDEDFAGSGLDHLVHALGAQGGADGVGDGLCGDNVLLSDVFGAFVVDEGLGFCVGSLGLGLGCCCCHCWSWRN